MIIGLIFFILATSRKCRIFRGHLFSNAVKVMLFFSDVDHYVPVKLCKTPGSIHLVKILGHLLLTTCVTGIVKRLTFEFL